MPNISLSHYRGFAADQRLSMDIYARSVEKIAEKCDFDLKVVRPQSALERYSSNRFVMRYLRYGYYPKIARHEESDLHHILDHGYAHLYPNFANSTTKTCITVHDLIPKLTWSGSILSANRTRIPMRKPWLNLKSLSYLASYDRIATVSNSTKNDLVEHLGLQADKIDVIAPVIDDVFRPSSNTEINNFADKYEFNRRCKWLMISGSEYYKNHRTCLKVLAELNRQHEVEFRIVKTGRPSDDFNAMIAEFGLESKVKLLFVENTQQLAHLYGLVDCLLFPSLYEGFGMPVTEALACGTPVVTSDRGSLPEVSGSLAGICDAGDILELSREVTSMVFDDQRRLLISEQGPDWVAQFRQAALEYQLRRFYHATLKS